MFHLMPKDEGFFDIFDRTAANLHEGAVLLKAMMDSDLRDVGERAKQIHNVEHQGDELVKEAMEKLDRSFIAPFDREEIHELVHRLDDALDLLDNAAARIALYKIKAPTDDARALADVLLRCTVILSEVIPLLRNIKRPQLMRTKCLEVKKLEAEGDRIEAHALATLFEGHDPIEVIKWKDIYNDLETATDKCQDVAIVIESILIRHA
ncbi:MAG TPA: DUF47 family protein [Planctomycetota bacterium]|nr:DUF47 family protein [Planctomycetota bacterium]